MILTFTQGAEMVLTFALLVCDPLRPHCAHPRTHARARAHTHTHTHAHARAQCIGLVLSVGSGLRYVVCKIEEPFKLCKRDPSKESFKLKEAARAAASARRGPPSTSPAASPTSCPASSQR